MKILALDLSWKDPTGWVHWDTDATDPVLDYGQIKTATVSSKFSDDERLQMIIRDFRDKIATLLKNYQSQADLFLYEKTDWRRNLTGKGKNLNVEYDREIKAQRSLSRAEAILIMTSLDLDLPLKSIGANEAKREFGAIRKDACAEIFCAEFTRFNFRYDQKGWWLEDDLRPGLKLSDHISDVFVIAAVQARRERLNGLDRQV